MRRATLDFGWNSQQGKARQICSTTIFEKHTAPGAYSKHTPGVVCISIWSRGIFDLEYSFRLL